MARPGFRQHPKFKRLVHLLREPVPHVWGYCECLWDVAYQNGDAAIGDVLDVELAAEYPGEPGKLAKALRECRLIDQREDGCLEIHDLFENAPEFVKKRFARDQVRKNKYSPRNRRIDGNGPPNSGISRRSAELGKLGATHSTAQDLDASASCSEPASPSAEPEPSPSTEEKIILTFPTVGKGGKEWHLTEDKLNEYRESFPGVDARAQCRAALQWCRGNPARRKTPRGMAAFLTRWLSKEQNRGGSRASGAASPAIDEREHKRKNEARMAELERQARRERTDQNGSE